MRIDLFLVENNYYESRNKAQDAIKKGAVFVDGKRVLKSSLEVSNDNIIEIKFESLEFVSRGGYKLKEAIEKFDLDFNDKIILDIGSSTGGFTDCALKYNAKLIYSVDVGSNQLHHSLRNNNKIKVYENTNILDFKIDINFDFIVMDVSFVSINHIIPALNYYLNDNNYIVCLIKPQFELGYMVNKGIIKDKKIHLNILKNVEKYLNVNNIYINKILPSPIKGGSGNIEFISLLSRKNENHIDFNLIVEEAHKKV